MVCTVELSVLQVFRVIFVFVVTPRKKGSIGDVADGISPNKVERRRSEKEKKPTYDIGSKWIEL